MQLFLDQVVARIVAIYLCFYCSRKLWYGLVERKIAYWNDDFIDWLLIDWSKVIAHRDATPVRYWILIGLRIICVVGCLGVAILGWWRPNP
jgi:CHASE2 domain-containing sensor protein